MKVEIFSYRFAREILEHRSNLEAWTEIIEVTSQAPLFTYAGKSKRNPKLDVVQQVMNTWFDRALAVDRQWLYHPLATAIENSKLAADFRKIFPNIAIQAEVQFGNMSRWYSDIFKLQTAYAQGLAQMGLSIVPMGSLARRIDSNVVSYERVVRELPSADLSITPPILVIGIEPDDDTPVVDLRKCSISYESLTKADGRKKSSEKNRYRVVEAHRQNIAIDAIEENSNTGPMANPIIEIADEQSSGGDF